MFSANVAASNVKPQVKMLVKKSSVLRLLDNVLPSCASIVSVVL